MTCKDCLHYEVCIAFNPRESFATIHCAEECPGFTIKSEWIHLPFPIGTVLYRVTNPYRQEPKITEFVVTNFVMQGKKHELMVEVRVNGIPGRNVMRLRQFCRTRSEAEKELAERRNQ